MGRNPTTFRVLYCLALAFAGSVGAQEEVDAGADWESDEAWLGSLLGLDEGPEEGEIDGASVAALEKELEAALRSLVAPTVEGSVEVSAGWKENVLLEAEGSVDAAFRQASLDFFYMRPSAGEGWELMGTGLGEYRDYDGVPGMEAEYLALAYGAATRKWSSGRSFEVFVGGMASRQAFDASVDDFVTEARTVSVWSPEVGLGVEAPLPWEMGLLGLEWSAAQSRYDESSEDFDGQNWRAEWTRGFGRRSKLAFGVEAFEESYDFRRERLSVGSLANAPLLRMEGWRWTAEWSYVKSDGALRRARTRVTVEREDDRVGDYYERSKWQARQSAQWRLGEWTLDANLGYGDFGYEHRRAGVGAETRTDLGWRAEATLTRKLWSGWEGLLQGEWVEKDSNAAEYSYESSSARLGLRWGFLGQD